jgi:hypothetical protein
VPKRTHAPQQTGLLFDYLVGAGEQRRRHGEAERLGADTAADEILLRHQPQDPQTFIGTTLMFWKDYL